MMKNSALASAGALMLIAACSGGRDPGEPAPAIQLPPISLASVGDSVMYLEHTHSLTVIERPSDTVRVSSDQTAVIHVMRTAPDSLEAFYEHLRLRFETPTQMRNIDTRALLGPRFVLQEDDGRVTTVSAPALPDEIRQLADLRRQFDDFFLRLPAHSLDVGVEWVDTLEHSGAEGEASMRRSIVTRYRVARDTLLEGLAARIIEYETAIDASLRSAPTTEGVLMSTLVGAEEGRFVYAPERDVMLRRWRVGVLEGEVVVEGNLETHRFPQLYSYENTIELIPPAIPGAAQRHPPNPRPTPQP
jgi:hypothetical protein